MKIIKTLLILGLIASSQVLKADVITLMVDGSSQPFQTVYVSSCDTLVVVNNSGLTCSFSRDSITGGLGNWDLVYPDSMSGQWGFETSYFNSLDSLSIMVIHHQIQPTYYHVIIEPCVSSSISETITKAFEIYPNPTTDKVTLQVDNSSKGQVIITDALGRVIQDRELFPQDGNKLKLDVASLLEGVYSLTIIQGEDRNSTKFVKQ